MAEIRTPQENGALILRAQRDAADLLRRAEREEKAGSVAIVIALEDVRRIAATIADVAALKEGEHLEVYRGVVRG